MGPGSKPDWRLAITRNPRLMARLNAMLDRIAAYPTDPGTSDLYDEQPVSVSLLLGDVRLASMLVYERSRDSRET